MTINPTDAPERDPEQSARRLQLAVIGGGVLLVAVFAFFIYQALSDESSLERWDQLDQIRVQHEPNSDPIWQNPFGVYNAERTTYIAALESFLDKRASEDDDALAPHTRYIIAKTIADHILSNPGILDQEERGAFYKTAVAQLETIRKTYPDFPLNWSTLSEGGFPSLTRQFIGWLNENQKWENKYMMRAVEPSTGVRVLIRTDRGDMLMGLYTEQAPGLTTAFLNRATRGFYDGTFFSMKTEIGDVATPEVHSLMAGGAATRDLKPYDMKSAQAAAAEEVRSALMPEASRSRIPQDRGIVSAWHPLAAETYDNDSRFLVLARRSPRMDYKYTPFAKLVNENGIDSLLTMDRIFGSDVWHKDPAVRDDTDLRPIYDALQVPVKIIKVLVYEDGALKKSGEGVLETKAKPEDGESQLSSVKTDGYKQEPPVKPGEEATDDDE